MAFNCHQTNEVLGVEFRGISSPLYHVLQVAELGLPRGHDLDGVGGEGAVDEPPGVQETQSVHHLQQDVQEGLCLQHWELCTLGKKKNKIK